MSSGVTVSPCSLLRKCDITTLVVADLVGGEVLAADVYLDGERI